MDSDEIDDVWFPGDSDILISLIPRILRSLETSPGN